MRELNVNEIEQVNGGLLPLLGFGLAVVSHAGARTVVGYFLTRASSLLAGYELAKYFSKKNE